MHQPGSLEDLSRSLAAFARERDWDQFHTPKNLSMALAVEVAEIMEIFQWKSTQESFSLSAEKSEHLREELADCFIYLVRLADIAGIDLLAAAQAKIEKNHSRYPPELVRGSAAKYSEYDK
jgi:NTP pyrophosphatase (non-canonical NTP hydrolase)